MSTADGRGSIGPRAHVTGFLKGLRDNSIDPLTYLVGDSAWAARLSGDGNDTGQSSMRRQFLNDAARLALSGVMQREARKAIGDAEILYERQATFQQIGRSFQRRGSFWIIESNGPFWYEASVERRNLALARTAKRLELSAYNNANLVVAVSESLKSVLLSETDRKESDILVIPNATDTDRFDPSKADASREFSTVTMGFSGYLAEWAGIDLAIEAVGTLKRQGVDLSFTVLGDGPARSSLEQMVRVLGIDDRVKFLGRLPWSRVPNVLAGFDIGYSGQREMAIGSMYHSPQKLYEYMSMGLPVIASAYDDSIKLTSDGGGWTFTSGSSADLAKVLSDVILDSSKLKQEGRRARAKVVENHSWKNRVSMLLAELRLRGVLRDGG